MKTPSTLLPHRVWLAIGILGAGSALVACGGDDTEVPPTISARQKNVITVDDLPFKDLDSDGKLTPYEDWRRGADTRMQATEARCCH